MNLPSEKHPKGFTMTEVLVVMAIITILGSIIYPSYQRMKSQAGSTLCAGKMRDIGIAISTYMIDHGPRFPTMESARESRDDDVPVMDTVLKEYLPDEFAFQCPSDHEGIFEKTGSSYFWNSLINGQMMGNMDLLGLSSKESGIPIASDKENFHRGVGDEVNILYADGHVFRELQFIVDQ